MEVIYRLLDKDGRPIHPERATLRYPNVMLSAKITEVILDTETTGEARLIVLVQLQE